MRVGIIAIQHESNTFLDRPTTIADFQRDVYLIGEEVRAKYANAHHEVGGFFEGLAGESIDAVPLFMARAVPSGVITQSACEKLLAEALGQLDKTPDIDGLLVAPHGAAVGEVERDFDGYWLTAIRKQFGPNKPMICTLDLHANVSQRMIDACNATIAYRTNPHLDQRACGIEAAKLMARTLRGEVHPTQAAAFPPIQINIERQNTTESPCRELYAEADKMLGHQPPLPPREGRGEGLPPRESAGARADSTQTRSVVLSNSIVLGFPYADVFEMGSSTIVVTDNNPRLAKQLADQLANYILDHRTDFLGKSVPVEQAVAQAMKDKGPICLLDMGDNVGGGSPGDSTIIAREMHRIGASGFVCLNDPSAVIECNMAGIGRTLDLALGGKSDNLHGEPLKLRVKIKSLHGGHFSDHTPRHGGSVDFKMGECAVVETVASPSPGTPGEGRGEGRTPGLTILLTSLRTPPFSLGMLTSCNLNPKDFQIIVAKGVHAPVAAYKSVCTKFIRVDTPGITTANMSLLDYKFRRKPLYPLEKI